MRYAKTVPATTTAITNANIISPVLRLDQDYGYAVQAIWTDGGSLAGTVKLQVSVDGNTFSDIVGSSQTVTGSGSFLWNVNGAFYAFVRCVFTYSAGAGTIQFNTMTKGP